LAEEPTQSAGGLFESDTRSSLKNGRTLGTLDELTVVTDVVPSKQGAWFYPHTRLFFAHTRPTVRTPGVHAPY
jgi:hypothetical protein